MSGRHEAVATFMHICKRLAQKQKEVHQPCQAHWGITSEAPYAPQARTRRWTHCGRRRGWWATTRRWRALRRAAAGGLGGGPSARRSPTRLPSRARRTCRQWMQVRALPCLGFRV